MQEWHSGVTPMSLSMQKLLNKLMMYKYKRRSDEIGNRKEQIYL